MRRLELDEGRLPESGVIRLTEQEGDGGGKVGETGAGDRCSITAIGVRASTTHGASGACGTGDQAVALGVLGVVVENTGDGIGGVGSFGVTVAVKQFFGIAVVGGDDEDAADAVNGTGETFKGEVNGFQGDNGGLKFGKVADHIAAGEIDADETELVQALQDGVGEFGGFHPGAGVKGLGVGGDFQVFFAGG